MAKFKVGDRVKIRVDCSGCITDEVYTLMRGYVSGGNKYKLVARGGKIEGNGCGCHCQHNWIKFSRGRPRKEKQVKYIAIYEENNVDPVKKFTSRKELIDWIKEAKEDEDIDFDSIEVFEVNKRLEVKVKTRVFLK